MLGYDSLPATIPVTRWIAAPKSLFIALRIPLINLMTLGLIELLSLGLQRAKQFGRADAVVAVLLLTAAAKAGLEAAGILMLPVSFSWTLIPLVAVISVGLATAAFLGRDFLHPVRWRQLRMTRLETAGALALVMGIGALNLPLVLRPWDG
jgi:fatty acid desaturase